MSVASARRPYRIFLLNFVFCRGGDRRSLEISGTLFSFLFCGKKTAAEGGIVDRTQFISKRIFCENSFRMYNPYTAGKAFSVSAAVSARV